MPEDGFGFSRDYYIMPFDDTQGAFFSCNNPINGADLVVGWPVARGAAQSGTTENTEQPGPNERRAGLGWDP